MMTTVQERPRIGFLIIGDEILSGRTTEKNLATLASMLAQKGLAVNETRTVSDSPAHIADSLQQMRATHDYVFTSGGIGPTHDDVTADGVALAFGVVAEENADAAEILAQFYQQRGLEFTPARRRMARAPQGAKILRSKFPGAPGFVMDNVFVCAGVPDIFQLMAQAAMAGLPDCPLTHSVSLRANGPESELAFALENIQKKNPDLQIGSYPREEDGRFYCNLVFSGENKNAALSAAEEMQEFLTQAGISSSFH